MAQILRALLVSARDWVSQPQIQRMFHELTGSNIYKPVMDRLRENDKIAQRETEHNGKKFWSYKIG